MGRKSAITSTQIFALSLSTTSFRFPDHPVHRTTHPDLLLAPGVQVWAISSQHHVNAHRLLSSFHCSPTAAEHLSHSHSRFLRVGNIGGAYSSSSRAFIFVAVCLPPAACTASLIDSNTSFCIANNTHHFPYSRILVQHNLWLMWM